jgi:hypothetical protein
VVRQTRRDDAFPPWGIPAIIGGVVLLGLLLFFLFRNPDDSSNVNVALRANANRYANSTASQTSSIPPAEVNPVSIPPASGGVPAMPPTTTTSVPGSTTGAPVAPVSDKGNVVIRAKVVGTRGDTQPARSARFYLLDKDPEQILSEARVEPIEGNSLSSSLGLAAVFPDRYGDFQRAAMRALGAHTQYSGTTDGSGSASVGNIAPKEYFLFCIFRVGKGFAMWNSPVSIVGGQNELDLSPQSVTEIDDSTNG